jgi:peptidoglycan hydrolase-like protein with peptidoglycan-binding domain
MKKQYIYVGLFLLTAFLGGLAFTPSVVSADTMTCTTLKTSLSTRTNGQIVKNDVIALQDFLRAQGFFTLQSSGYFGSVTMKAVQNFQTSRQILASGFVGPLTRTEIARVSCAVSTQANSTTPQNNSAQTASVILAPIATTTITTSPTPAISFPYKTENFSDWKGTWGGVATTSVNTLLIKASTTSSGGEAIFPLSNDWKDYRYTADVTVSNGVITLIGRYVDEDNFLACTFSGNGVVAQQRLNGQTTTLASGTIPDFSPTQYFQKSISVAMRVQGTTVGCSASAATENVTYTGVDSHLMKGGIGIETWFQDLGVATLELRSVNVTSL